MGRVTTIICILLFAFTADAKSSSDSILHLVKEKTISGRFNNFYTDNLGNVFLVTDNNQVKKLNQSLDSVAVFNDVRRYGDVYSVDVNNPLKIAVYYKDFTTIVVLDRFLNIRNSIDLRNIGILQAKAITQSYDNNYWVFDELNSKIKKIDDNGNVLFESADFRTLFSEEYNPQFIIDADGALYLYDINKGWRIFDYYGAYKKHIDLLNWKDIAVVDKKLFGRDSVYFYSADLMSFNESRTKTNIETSKAIKIQQRLNRFFILEKDNLSVYRIE